MNSYGSIHLSNDDRGQFETFDNVKYKISSYQYRLNSIGVASYTVMYSCPNINENNNIAYIETATQTYPIILPVGYYDYITFRNEMIAQLLTLGLGAFTVSYTPQQTILITGPVPFKFITNPLFPAGRDWSDMAGMKKNTPLNTVHSGLYVDLTYTNSIYITSTSLSRNRQYSDESSTGRLANIMAVVYVNKNISMESLLPTSAPQELIRPRYITQHYENIKYINLSKDVPIDEINIELYDDRGEKLPPSCFVRYNIEFYTN